MRGVSSSCRQGVSSRSRLTGSLRVIDPKSMCDLLGAPRGWPAPALPKHGATLLPYHLGTCEAGTIDVRDLTREMLLDIGA